MNTNIEKATLIIHFISSFLKFGDGFRRLVARSLTEKFDLNSLMREIATYSDEFNSLLQQLCGGLVNDQLFIRNFSQISYDVILNSILKNTTKVMLFGGESVSYQSFSEKVLEFNIVEKKWNWVHFFLEVFSFFKELFYYDGKDN